MDSLSMNGKSITDMQRARQNEQNPHALPLISDGKENAKLKKITTYATRNAIAMRIHATRNAIAMPHLHLHLHLHLQ